VPKIGANWFKIKTGDIISFRYKPVDKIKPLRTHSIMVLNPKYPKTLKNGEKKFYINGIKLESSNIKVLKSKDETWTLLKTIGWITIRSLKNEIYRVSIFPQYLGQYGAKEKLYNVLRKSPIGKRAEYRTYDWITARKKAVFYEPMDLPGKRIKMLVEQEQQGDKEGPPVADDVAVGKRDVGGGDEKVIDGTLLGDIKELLK